MLRITCQQASRLLSQQQDQPLSLHRRIQLRAHLVICDACRNVQKQFEAMQLAVQRWRDRDLQP